MANPTILTWRHDGKNVDESAFTAEQYAGFELELNGQAAVSVPVAFSTEGRYSLPLADLAAVQTTGSYNLRMRTVAKSGAVSAWSEGVSFSMDFRVPAAPYGLSVSG